MQTTPYPVSVSEHAHVGRASLNNYQPPQAARTTPRPRLRRLPSPQVPPILDRLFSRPPRTLPSPNPHLQRSPLPLWKPNEAVLDFSLILLTRTPLLPPRNKPRPQHNPLLQSITPLKPLAYLA